MILPSETPPPFWSWRGAGVPFALLALSLLWQLPLFLCEPRWSDSYYYDAVAAGVLRGDPVYRDLLLHVAPGMQLAQAGARAALGWSNSALRFFDAVVFLLAAWLLACLAAPPRRLTRRLWIVLAAGLFYFGGSEWIHCQPDGWMLLPALGALALRARRWTVPAIDEPDIPSGLPELEGILWGMACLIKPFPAVVAAAAAATTWCAGGRPLRRVVLEELRVLLGGVFVLAFVYFWLRGSRNWEHWLASFKDPWWKLYYKSNLPPLAATAELFRSGRPWTIVEPMGLAVGLLDMAWAWRAGPGERVRRGLMGAACVAWLFQANALQTKFHYQLAPALLLCLGVGATLLQRRPAPHARLATLLAGACLFAPLLPGGKLPEAVQHALVRHGAGDWAQARLPWPALAALGAAAAYALARALGWRRAAGTLLVGVLALIVSRHALLVRERLALWPSCWRHMDEPWLMDRLEIHRAPGVNVGFAELAKVGAFLREQGVRDGEIECFSASTLPLYTQLGLRPPHRYLIPTVLDLFIHDMGADMDREIRRSGRKYSVCDRGCDLDDKYRARHGTEEHEVVYRNARYEVRRVTAPRLEP